MKLVHCNVCCDIFKLSYELRSCECGLCCGRYDKNGRTAVTNGKGHALAIGNGSLQSALLFGKPLVPNYEYKGYNVFLAWERPHDGPKNPHSRVDPDLGKETTVKRCKAHQITDCFDCKNPVQSTQTDPEFEEVRLRNGHE